MTSIEFGIVGDDNDACGKSTLIYTFSRRGYPCPQLCYPSCLPCGSYDGRWGLGFGRGGEFHSLSDSCGGPGGHRGHWSHNGSGHGCQSDMEWNVFYPRIKVDGKEVELEYHDYIGNHSRHSLLHALRNMTWVDCFLLCFSIDSPKTLEKFSKLNWKAIRKHNPGSSIILVGNKKDLRNDPATIESLAIRKQEPVKPEEGRAMALKIGAFAYVECSAKNMEGVNEVFETAARAALLAKEKKEKAKTLKCTVL